MEKGINLKENKNDRVTIMQKLINFKKNHPLLRFKFVSLNASLEVENKKGFFGQNRWRFSRKAKSLVVFTIIIVMLISILSFLPKQSESIPLPKTTDTPTASPSSTTKPNISNQPSMTPTQPFQIMWQDPNMLITDTPKPPGDIKSAKTVNSTMWLAVAKNAWAYFQPGVGVNPKTGLPTSGYGSPCFTDWDLGVYIQAVMDAQNLNLTNTDGDWGSSARIEKIVTFLETRPLNDTTHYPFWFYQSKDGQNWHQNSDLATEPVDVVDTGRLFVALNNLRIFNSSLVSRINNVVLYGQYNNRSNYAVLVPSIEADGLTSTSIYAYYVYSGFACFWPDSLSATPSRILDNILSAGNVTVNGISLPAAAITGDPLLCSVFELNNNDPELMALTNQVYLAHMAYYNSTSRYRAFSEGPSFEANWQWEWVVLPDHRSWVVLNGTGQVLNTPPLVYAKVAISFLAIYNSSFAKNLSVYVEDAIPTPVDGYCEGVDEAGAVFDGVGLNTNGLILDAASYAIFNSPQNP